MGRWQEMGGGAGEAGGPVPGAAPPSGLRRSDASFSEGAGVGGLAAKEDPERDA